MLDKHQIQDYYKNGFIVIDELLNKDEIKKTRGIICLLYTSDAADD